MIAELITGVNIALEPDLLSHCLSFDEDGNELVAIDEILLAVNAALYGCVARPPTATATPMSSTPTSEPIATAPAATATPTATDTAAETSPTETYTLTPTTTATPAAATTPTSSPKLPVSCPPAVQEITRSFQSPGNLTAAEYELPALAAGFQVSDVRQRHRVRVSFTVANCPPSSVVVRFSIPGLADRIVNASVVPTSFCPWTGAEASVIYEDLPPGEYTLSTFVAGSGSFASATLEIGPPPAVLVSYAALGAGASVGAGEHELTDLRTSVTVGDSCEEYVAAVFLSVTDSRGTVRLSTPSAPDVTTSFPAGGVNHPSFVELRHSFTNLNPEAHTFSVFVTSESSGPMLILPGSYLEISKR